MSTSCFEALSRVPARIGELKLLIEHAKSVELSNEALYNALCRACCVLMAAQLEGFIKELSSGILSDFNFFVKDFGSKPPAMQREFCRRIAFFDGVPNGEVEKRVKALMSFFSKNSVPIEPSSFPTNESPNKNPGADVIDAAFAKLGVPAVVYSIGGSFFDEIFSNDSRASYRVTRECARARSYVYAFPYRLMPSKHQFSYRGSVGSTLWHAYIESVMRRRHMIAHGDTVANVTTWEELDGDTNKLNVFMHAISFSACNYLMKK